MISLNRILNVLKLWIKNPYFNFFFPFLIIGVSTIFVRDKKSLCFYIQDPVRIEYLINKLSDKYKETNHAEFKNLHQIKLTIYNNGTEFIDGKDFITPEGIQLKNSGKIKILNGITYRKNRNYLVLKSKINTSDKTKISFKLANNEVFEVDDAITLKITYEEYKPGNWTLSTRIKGIKNGITKGSIHINEDKIIRNLIIIWVILFFILLFRYIIYNIFKKSFSFRSLELIFLGGLTSCSIILFYEFWLDYRIIEVLK